jgi:small-conductance mechanosensitive channel
MLINKIMGFLPNLLAAVIILVIGWFIARMLQKIVTNLLIAMGSEKPSDRVGLSKVLGSQGLAGLIVYILILIPVLIAALQALAIDAVTSPISSMLAQMLAILPKSLRSCSDTGGRLHAWESRC